MLRSNLGEENLGVSHIKRSRGPQIPHPGLWDYCDWMYVQYWKLRNFGNKSKKQ